MEDAEITDVRIKTSLHSQSTGASAKDPHGVGDMKFPKRQRDYGRDRYIEGNCVS